MQNYNNFTTEINTLEIRTKQVEVKHVPNLPFTTNPESLRYIPPTYITTTFLDLSHYDDQTSGYEAKLNRLRILAYNDLLLLTPEQQKNFLTGLKQVRADFDNIYKSFGIIHKANREGQLLPVMLHVHIYVYFSMPFTPDPNTPLDKGFIRDLYDALIAKSGQVSKLIFDVEKLLQTTSTAPPETDTKNSNEELKPPVLPAFTDKLINGFTENDLNKLLIHLKIKNSEGETLEFKKYLMHSVIDALTEYGFFTPKYKVKGQKALSKFLGLKVTRIKEGYGGKEESTAKNKALAYLKKEHKRNSSFLVP